MSPRPGVPPVLRGAAVVLAVIGVGAGTLMAAGAAAERDEGAKAAPRAAAGAVVPDTLGVPEPAAWAIPALRPARVEVRDPPATARDGDPRPPLVRLSTADAPPAPGSPGQATAAPVLPAPVPLSAREVEAILAPLPDLPRAGSAAGGEDAAERAIEGAGPGAAAPAVAGVAPVRAAHVVGVFPSGDAEVVPDVTVVFSHPVVPLGAVGEATSVPFRWEPEVAGGWHWLDATTARFLPRDGRLPGGQSYRLRVDPGFGGSAGEGLGVPLPHEVDIRIRGPLALGGSGQGMILSTAPVMVLGFDQRVDPDVVAAHTSFRVLGDAPNPGPAALQAAQVVRAVARPLDDAPEGYRDAVRSARYAGAAAVSPATPLPPGTWIRLEVDPELTSTEGPLATGRRQELNFRTADSFHLADSPCATAATACAPRGTEVLTFSNQVDAAQPLDERVRVTPEVPGLQFRTMPNGALQLHGPFQPWTAYRIRVDGDLVDVFGSRLGEPLDLTLHFGRALPLLSIRGAPFVTLDPSGARELEVPVRALDRVSVRILAADPARWDEWFSRGPSFRAGLHDRVEGLRELERLELTPDDGGEGFSFLHVPLARALDAAGGQVVVVVTGTRDAVPPPGSGDGGHRVEVGAWVQVPSVRLQLLGDAEHLVVHARTLDGTPAADVRLALPQVGVGVATDAEGFASFPLSPAGQGGARLLVAESGGHTTLVPSASAGSVYPVWAGDEGAPGPVWVATTDRPLYRPGEPLAVQGWVQEVVPGEARELKAPDRIRALRYEVLVPTAGGGGRRTVHSGEVDVSPTGGFHLLVELPDALDPGQGQVRLTALGENASGEPHSGSAWSRDLWFRTADFRRPDYEVSVSLPPEVLLPDEPFQVVAEARYFDGPGLPGSELRWTLSARPGHYAPPGWQNPVAPPDAGTVPPPGSRDPWRFTSSGRSPLAWAPSRSSMVPVVHEARTDATGNHRLEITPTEVTSPFPLTLVTSVTVQDLNRQAGSASANAILLSGRALPGIRVLPLAAAPSGRLVAGDSVDVEVVVLDAEGFIIPADWRARPEVRVERLAQDPDAERFSSRWVVAAAAPVTCSPATVPAPQGSPHGPSVEGYRCRAPLPDAGDWLVSAVVADEEGRQSRTEADVHVFAPGAGVSGWMGQARGLPGFSVPGSSAEALEVELEEGTTARGDLLPGDTVTLRIRAPFAGGKGMAALDHGGIRRILALDMEAGETEHRIRFPVEGAPGARVVEILLESPEGDRGASGRVGFEVATDARRLALAVEAPAERVEPGATIPVSVTVTGDAGNPVAGVEVTIWLVDEAALFAAGSGARAFTAEYLDPWVSLYQGARGIRSRGGLWLHTLRERRPPGDGVLQGRLLDAFTGAVATGTLEVTGSDGIVHNLRPDPSGEIHVANLPPGDLRVRFLHQGNDIALDRTVTRDADEGVDLGTLLMRPRVPPQPLQDGQVSLLMRTAPAAELAAPRAMAGLALQEIVVSGTEFEGIEFLAFGREVGSGAGYVRKDFTPLAGMAPRVVTDEDGVARTTFRLPDTLTRYRILAVARSGDARGPSAGAGEGLVVAGRDLVVRATPPLFLRTGDQGDISLLVENGGEVDRDVEIALRATGLTLEGTGGIRIQVPAGGRREVRVPARASEPGAAGIQARAVSGAVSDAVEMQVAVEIPAAPERMAFRTLLEPGVPRFVLLEPAVAVSPGWGGLEVVVSPSLTGSLGGELLTLSETTLPWAGLRIARVRGATALARAMERDPDLGASLDSVALARLQRTVAEDMDVLGRALRWVRPAGITQGVGAATASEAASGVGSGLLTAAGSLGTWSVHVVLEASQALEEARRAGLLPTPMIGFPAPPAPIPPSVLRPLLGELNRPPGPSTPGPGAVDVSTLDLAILWTLHRANVGLSALPRHAGQAVADLDTEGMRPLWLARIAAMVARAEADRGGSALPAGTHHRFLEALENRAMITPGGVTFRRGTPIPGAAVPGVEGAFHFSASNPSEDAEVLLALVEVAPNHPLLPGLVASVAGPDLGEAGSGEGGDSRASWGPDVVGRALPALEAWAQVHAGGPVNTTVALALAGIPAPGPGGGTPLRVRSGEPPEARAVTMDRLLEAQAGAQDGQNEVDADGTTGARLSLPLSLEAAEPDANRSGSVAGAGPISARVLLTWTAADPFQPAMMRGFVVRRAYEGVDDADDVRRDADGTWRIRAGARVRVLHELLLPERRMDIRLEDPFPAGFEPVQGTSGDEGAGRAPGVVAAEILLDGRWGLTGGTSFLLAIDGLPWYRELRFGRTQATAWAPALSPGTYRGSWVARATLPGDYVVPGVRAFEAGRPDVMGRSEAHRVVVEAW
jgi:hypothetical protein